MCVASTHTSHTTQTYIPQELLLCCVDAELLAILRAFPEYEQDQSRLLPADCLATLRSNRSGFAFEKSSEAALLQPSDQPSEFDHQSRSTATPSIHTTTSTAHSLPSAVGSDDPLTAPDSEPPTDAYAQHQLYLVLRFACAVRALGVPISPARSGDDCMCLIPDHALPVCSAFALTCTDNRPVLLNQATLTQAGTILTRLITTDQLQVFLRWCWCGCCVRD